jgi:hypothetical protein
VFGYHPKMGCYPDLSNYLASATRETMITYPDGTQVLAGDNVVMNQGREPGVVHAVIDSPEMMDAWCTEETGLMVDLTAGGLNFWPQWSLRRFNGEIKLLSRRSAEGGASPLSGGFGEPFGSARGGQRPRWLNRMNRKRRPNRSFFSRAAWYAVTAPFVALGLIWLGMVIRGSHASYDHRLPDVIAFNVAACIAVTSALASLISLFGIPRHGWLVILWKALLGVVLSSGAILEVLILEYGVGTRAGLGTDGYTLTTSAQQHAADGSQSFRSVAIRASAAAGSHR